MKTKFIYVILAVLLMGSQMTLSAQNTDNKQKKQRPTPEPGNVTLDVDANS